MTPQPPRRRHSPVLALLAVLLITSGTLLSDDLPWVEGSTTLVVLPDTEVYANKKPDHFRAQMRWIRDKQHARNIAYVLHVGDVTNHNTEREWRVARECFDILEGKIPYVLAAGNHDYDNTPGRLTLMNEFFDVTKMKEWPSFGGVHEEGHLENHFQLTEIQGRGWIILSLECGPRNAVIDWANEVLARHRDRLAIVLTHAYLYYDNQRYDHTLGRQRASPHAFYGEGADGEALWNALIRKHRNVMMVICGHLSSGYVGYRADPGDHGNVVHQMMVDYEKMRDGGMGYLRLLEFLPDRKTVQVRTYSPVTGGVNPRDPELEEYAFKLRMATRETPEPAARDGSSKKREPRRAPKHRYAFDRDADDGALITDSVGNAHGRLVAGATRSALDGEGRLRLEGDGHVLLPASVIRGLRDLSFEVWFEPLAESYKWSSVVRFGSRDDWLTYVFRTLSVHRAEIAVDRHNEDIQVKVPVTPGTPLHVVVTYDEDGADGKALLSYFRDGELIRKMPTELRLSDVESSTNTIGPFAGSFDELRIYDASLDAREVRASFQAGADELDIVRAKDE